MSYYDTCRGCADRSAADGCYRELRFFGALRAARGVAVDRVGADRVGAGRDGAGREGPGSAASELLARRASQMPTPIQIAVSSRLSSARTMSVLRKEMMAPSAKKIAKA